MLQISVQNIFKEQLKSFREENSQQPVEVDYNDISQEPVEDSMIQEAPTQALPEPSNTGIREILSKLVEWKDSSNDFLDYCIKGSELLNKDIDRGDIPYITKEQIAKFGSLMEACRDVFLQVNDISFDADKLIKELELSEKILLTKKQESARKKSLIESLDEDEDKVSYNKKLKNIISTYLRKEPFTNNSDWGSAYVWNIESDDNFLGTFIYLGDDDLLVLERTLVNEDEYSDVILKEISSIKELKEFLSSLDLDDEDRKHLSPPSYILPAKALHYKAYRDSGQWEKNLKAKYKDVYPIDTDWTELAKAIDYAQEKTKIVRARQKRLGLPNSQLYQVGDNEEIGEYIYQGDLTYDIPKGELVVITTREDVDRWYKNTMAKLIVKESSIKRKSLLESHPFQQTLENEIRSIGLSYFSNGKSLHKNLLSIFQALEKLPNDVINEICDDPEFVALVLCNIWGIREEDEIESIGSKVRDWCNSL